MTEIENLRLKLLANGYVPIANFDKRCFLKNWPKVEVTPELVHEWARRNKRFDATGLRVEGGLAVIDIDINIDAATADAIADAVHAAVPAAAQALVRWGKGTKEAWFVRTEESFSRIHSRRWTAPGEDHDAGTHVVEIFGGLSPRQFGAFGAHTKDEDGVVLVRYDWPDGSPLDTPLGNLPRLTKAQFFTIADTIERVLEQRGCKPVLKSTRGENEAERVYDLTDEMSFDMADGRTLTLAQLREVEAAEEGLRCSASWLEGPDPNRSMTRCLIGHTMAGNVMIWDSATGCTHLEAANKPRDYRLDLDRAAERLLELDAKRRYKVKPIDDAVTAAAKLLETYAFCPPLNKVVPIWATDVDQGLVMPAFRTMLIPNCDEDVGPRGGRVVISPVDIWAGDERRKTVEGLRLRPDMPRPLFEDRGKLWVNVYQPPELPAEGGDPTVGLEFIEQLLPDPFERSWFLQWLSHKYQRPDIPGPAVVMVARDYGSGRGTLAALLAKLFGQTYVRNVPYHIFSGRSYQSQYTDWAMTSLLVFVSESSEANGGSMFAAKRDTYEHLKELIEPRPIERTFILKGTASVKTLSFTSYVIATNNIDALPIPPEDRRFAVLTNGGKRPVEFWDRVNAWMDDDANVAAFGRWLEAVDLSGYSPFAAPPETAAKSDMADAARTDLDRAVDEAMVNMPSDVFVPEQVFALLREAKSLYGFDYPDKWETITKRLIQNRCWRVGERNGSNWQPQIENRRYSVFAKTKEAARKWTHADAHRLRAEVLKNGSPKATGLPGNVLLGAFRRASQEAGE